MTDLIFLDIETTGLDPDKHEIWEIAYAVNDGPVINYIMPHQLKIADPKALELNHYFDRVTHTDGPLTDIEVQKVLTGNTLVGANPAFDAAFLRKRWGGAPWHYRMIDVESMALGIMGWERPKGLNDIAAALREEGYDVPEPDHSAYKDVVVLREAYGALRDIQEKR